MKRVNGKVYSAFEKVSVPGNFRGLIEQYRCNVCTMRTHLFHLEWQRMQFSLITDTLKPGEVVFVIDFARNFAHVFQDEPRSAHWDQMQSTMHPCVAYYKCKCDSTVMDEMIHFSPNLKHHAHAVDAFEQRTIEHLKTQNVDIKCIYEFLDNCSSQYKSKAPFKKLSCSDIPIIHNFFL